MLPNVGAPAAEPKVGALAAAPPNCPKAPPELAALEEGRRELPKAGGEPNG